jgi:cytochrome d ubiquinol oxidase subunit II
MIDLPLVWAFVIAFAVFAYVVMDGFDLGIGILFPLYTPGQHRDVAMNSVAPVWDGNETWLVLGGGGLLAAFPLAYAIVLPALYAPIIAMLLALVFRGVAFEFRWRDPAHRRFWDISFAGGSIAATLAQGIILGALLQGIEVGNRAYAGGWWDWLTPFSLLCGLSLVVGYAALGACWLVMKTEGDMQAQAQRQAKWLGAAMLVCIALVSAVTPFLEAAYFERWFSWPAILLAAPVPATVVVLAWFYFASLANREERSPFFLLLGVFALNFVGLGISIYPNIVPGAVSIHDAAAPDASLGFVLVGAVVLIPVILAYTAYSYWVFRGKVGHEGYH